MFNHYILVGSQVSVSSYFIPNNPIAVLIVSIIAFLAMGWLLLLAYSARRIVQSHQAMNRMTDVRYLSQYLQTEGQSTDYSSSYESIYSEYCRRIGVNRKHPIAEHVGSIYQAGMGESRLDVEALTGYTERRIFISTGLLKSILSTFIVLGLLGTLLGLADSMAKLKPVFDQSISQASNERVSQALGSLLIELRSAFAPSIDGVLFTVIGLIILSLYLRFLCGPVKHELEKLTQTVWVHNLYPTVSQRLMEQMVAASTKMDNAMESAKVVTSLVDDVQEDMDDFSKRLKESRAITKDLTDSVHAFSSVSQLFNKAFVTQLANFGVDFKEGVTKLTSFQEEIRTLYHGIAQDSVVFRQSVSETMKGVVDRQDTILQALHCYEKAYIEQRGETESSVRKFIDNAQVFTSEATRANTSISQSNLEMLQQVQNNLMTELQTMRNELSEVTQVLHNIGNPMDVSAQKIMQTHENFANFMDNRVREFLEMTADLNIQLSELTKLPESNERIGNILEEFNASIQTVITQSAHSSPPIQPTENTTTLPPSTSSALNGKPIEAALQKLTLNIEHLSKTIHQFEKLPDAFEKVFERLADHAARGDGHSLSVKASWGGYSIT